ncbi:bZIP transcription factor 27-like [Apium graveolens]|uniref:bZIP transcription factor 27-like n=1 Tax=Apium graveolens TaxID=4045 RepID=UPI003D7979FF
MSPMWSSEKSDNHKNNKSFSSSTSSTSSSSTPSSFASNPKPLKTMEEVWKDINVPSLPGEDPHITNNINYHGVMNLQDFLAQPFAKSNHSPATHHVFNLNSCPDFTFDQPNSSNALPFEEFTSNSSSKKRHTDQDENMVDRRYKRMIKNRESAARSRARKQAYRFELEGEVAILKEENRRLKERQKLQLRLEEASQLATKPHTLCRTSTAPSKHKLCRTSTAPF